MKKNLLLAVLLANFCLSHLSAQTPEKPVKTGDEWKMPGDVIQRSKTFAAGLRKQLGLDSVQAKKVYEAYLANAKPLDEIAFLPLSDKEKDNRRKANKAAFDETLKGIFTPAQFDTYIRLAKNNK
jgi:hypothetical protein